MTGTAPNQRLLRTVARRLGNLDSVRQVNSFPSNKPATIETVFDATAYPPQISRVYVDVELQLNEEFFIHYVEQWETTRKECRWDRHENPHNARDHYHPFPDAATETAKDRQYPDDFFDVIGVVLADIESRWGETFEKDD